MGGEARLLQQASFAAIWDAVVGFAVQKLWYSTKSQPRKEMSSSRTQQPSFTALHLGSMAPAQQQQPSFAATIPLGRLLTLSHSFQAAKPATAS